jgi:hypothetical protein
VRREKELRSRFLSATGLDWHYFRYHLEDVPDHPFGVSLLRALAAIDDGLPGYADKMVDRLASHRGRERDWRDLEQLYQALAEVVVVRRLTSWQWPEPVTFATDARAPGTKKDVDLLLTAA